MDLGAPGLWWLATGLLVLMELMTGTFYLLMLALGAAAAAVVAHLGGAPVAQLLAAALIGGGATLAWHLKRNRRNDVGPRLEHRDVSLDVGERVTVDQWLPDGSARVRFRGSLWQARFQGTTPPRSGEHRIVALEGNHLILEPVQP